MPFHLWGLAVLIGLGALVVTLLGRPDDVVTTAVTVAVVLVVAALSPQHAWEQPILRLVDTAVGIAVGLASARIALGLTTRTAPGAGRIPAEVSEAVEAEAATDPT